MNTPSPDIAALRAKILELLPHGTEINEAALDAILTDDRASQARTVKAANDLVAGYAEQNHTFARFIETLSKTNGEYYGYALTLLKAAQRFIARTPAPAAIGPEVNEWEVFKAMLAAVDGNINGHTPDYLQGALAFTAERVRQVTGEGYDPEHDKGHTPEELAAAGMCYLNVGVGLLSETPVGFEQPALWPWASTWWKPAAEPFRNLEKGCALIAAAYDRHRLNVSASDRSRGF